MGEGTNSMTKMRLVPGHSVGPLVFGVTEPDDLALLGFEPCEDEQSVLGLGWTLYIGEDPSVEVFVADGLVDAVKCTREITFRGMNLVGLQSCAALALLELPLIEREPVWLPDGQVEVLDLESGVQLWVRGGAVESVFVDGGD